MEIFPLAQSGIPIDILLRIAVQSLNGLQGSASLEQGPSTSGASFYRVIQDLRQLQQTGGLIIGVERDKAGDRMTLAFSDDAGHDAVVRRLQNLLHLDPKRHIYNVSYGSMSAHGDAIAVVTRPMLGILGQIGAQAIVPQEDVARGRTRPTIIDFPDAARSAILVQNGESPPASSYAQIRYDRRWFWVADDDYDSKVAFTVVQVLEAVAQSTSNSQAPVITIPTN